MKGRLAAVLAALAVFAAPAFAQQGAARAEDDLVIVLRPQRVIEAATARARRDGALSWRPFAGDLVEVLALQGPDGVAYVRGRDLYDLRIDVVAAWAAAARNLPARLGALTIAPLEPGAPVFIVSGGAGLSPSALTGGGRCMQGGPAAMVALVTDRGEFVYADLDAPGAEARFFAVANSIIADGLSLSQTPITCRDGFWRAAVAPAAASP